MAIIAWFFIIGLGIGWLAGQIMPDGGFGFVRNTIITVIGALLGGYLSGLLGFSKADFFASLVTATLGAIILLLVVRVANRV